MINITSIASSYRLDYVGWEFRFGALVLHLTYSMDYMEWAFKFGALPSCSPGDRLWMYTDTPSDKVTQAWKIDSAKLCLWI